MATLEQILNFRNLTGVIQSIKGGIPSVLPPEFFTPGRKFSGNKGEYFKITGTRQVARLVQYGAPSQRINLREVDLVPVTLMHTYENMQWPVALTLALTKMTDLSQDNKGQQQAEYQSREFKRRLANLRIISATYALLKGILYFDASGNLLPTSSGAAMTIDFAIPSGNKTTVGGTFGATSWLTTTAKIMTDLLKLQTTALQLTGYTLEHAFYGDSVPGAIGTNVEAQNFLKLNPAMNQQYLTTGTIPNGFGGIKYWHRAGQAFYNDNGGTNRSVMGTGDITFTPAYDPDWFEVMEGSYPVPTNIMPQLNTDAAGALGSFSEQYGMFGYAQINQNPATVEQYAGDTQLPVLKVPAAVFPTTPVY